MQKGYEINTAASGEEAIEMLSKRGFDLVITDLVMEQTDGIQVLKTAKSLHPEIQVIIPTGYSDMASAIDALRFDADDYLLKPCEPEDMFFRVSSVRPEMASFGAGLRFRFSAILGIGALCLWLQKSSSLAQNQNLPFLDGH